MAVYLRMTADAPASQNEIYVSSGADYEPYSGNTGTQSGYFAQHTYEAGSYKMRVSNNISAIQVVGDMTNNGMTSQLTSVVFQDNLFQIMPSCFMNCEQLRNVEIKTQTKWISDYAFYGCRRLESVNALAYPKNTQVNMIGSHAFQNTGLTDITIDLTAGQYGAGIGEFAFADCASLKNVKIIKSTYIGRQAFDGCAALTSIQLQNSQSYYHPQAFANCTALSSMVIPFEVQVLNDGLFKDCISLQNVEIQDSSDKQSQLNYIGASVFYGCTSLTSITIPSSISSIMQIDPNFLYGSSIQQITFRGLSDDVFSSGYIESKATLVNGYVEQFDQFKNVANDAWERNIPIVMITIYGTPDSDLYKQDCDRCRALAGQLTSTDWQNYMNSVKNKCYFVLASQVYDPSLFMEVSTPNSLFQNPFVGQYYFGYMASLYTKVITLYKDPDGDVMVNVRCWQASWTRDGLLREIVDPIVSKANNPVQDESKLSSMISKMGSGLDYVTAYSMTGKEYKLSSDSYVEKYIPPEVDTETVSDFETGKWYYNAIELKSYADQTRLPVFVEFSDKYNEACVKFRNEIYSRSEFQEWVSEQPYLFCRVETENFNEFNKMFTQPYFVRTTWAENAQVTYPGMIFYWNRETKPVWEVIGYGDNLISYIELQKMIQRKFRQE